MVYGCKPITNCVQHKQRQRFAYLCRQQSRGCDKFSTILQCCVAPTKHPLGHVNDLTCHASRTRPASKFFIIWGNRQIHRILYSNVELMATKCSSRSSSRSLQMEGRGFGEPSFVKPIFGGLLKLSFNGKCESATALEHICQNTYNATPLHRTVAQ